MWEVCFSGPTFVFAWVTWVVTPSIVPHISDWKLTAGRCDGRGLGVIFSTCWVHWGRVSSKALLLWLNLAIGNLGQRLSILRCASQGVLDAVKWIFVVWATSNTMWLGCWPFVKVTRARGLESSTWWQRRVKLVDGIRHSQIRRPRVLARVVDWSGGCDDHGANLRVFVIEVWSRNLVYFSSCVSRVMKILLFLHSCTVSSCILVLHCTMGSIVRVYSSSSQWWFYACMCVHVLEPISKSLAC
jgi:hypothetical protein